MSRFAENPANSKLANTICRAKNYLDLPIDIIRSHPPALRPPTPSSPPFRIDSEDPLPPPHGDGDYGDDGDGAIEPGLCGVGVELQLQAPAAAGAEWVVAAVRPDGPAEASGVRCGDRIVSVNGYPIQACGHADDCVTLSTHARKKWQTRPC